MPEYNDYIEYLDYKYNNAEEVIENRLASLETTINDLTIILENYEIDTLNLKESIKKSNISNEEKENKIKKLEKELSQLKKEKIEILNRNKALLTEITIINKDLNNLDQANSKLNSTFLELKGKLEKSENICTEQVKIIKRLEESKSKLEQVINTIENKNETILKELDYKSVIIKELDQTNSDLNSRLTEFKEEIKTIKSDSKQKQTLISKTEEIIRSKIKDIEKEREKVGNLINENNANISTLKALEVMLDKAYEDNKKKNNLINEQVNSITNLKNTNNDIVNQKSMIKDELSASIKKLEFRTNTIIGLCIIIFFFILILGNLATINQKLEEDVSYNDSKIERIKENKEKLDQKINLLNSQIYSYKTEISELTKSNNRSYLLDKIEFEETTKNKQSKSFKTENIKYLKPVLNIISLGFKEIEINYITYSPSGAVIIRSDKKKFKIYKGNNKLEFSISYGGKEYGYWTKGTYRYVFYADDKIIAEENLKIY
ncbi:MAG: hypothetical protein JXR48_17775 [Candidatus Delongbacteria bacterium]|nr:hypothetical protein [Candidatus Delongbacteria bacterium]MBN2836808.1 hypothetical protein [Candidatus Delongbacteria bacterium]